MDSTWQEAVSAHTDAASSWSARIDVSYAQPVTPDPQQLRENRILHGSESSPYAESFHLLRTRILQDLRENGWNNLAVTSPRAGTGKSLTAMNLAISMSRLVGHSVLLVDTNLHQPALLKHLGLAEGWGLRDHLTDDIPVNNLLIRPDCFDDLVILPAGEPLDSSIAAFGSQRMQQLVQDLKSRSCNHLAILDLPPLLESADAVALANDVDAVLLVIEDGVTTRQDVTRAAELLQGTHLAGTVLNKAPAARAIAGGHRTRRKRLFSSAA